MPAWERPHDWVAYHDAPTHGGDLEATLDLDELREKYREDEPWDPDPSRLRPCANCRAWFLLDLDACPLCAHEERTAA